MNVNDFYLHNVFYMIRNLTRLTADTWVGGQDKNYNFNYNQNQNVNIAFKLSQKVFSQNGWNFPKIFIWPWKYLICFEAILFSRLSLTKDTRSTYFLSNFSIIPFGAQFWIFDGPKTTTTTLSAVLPKERRTKFWVIPFEIVTSLNKK